MVPLGHGPCTNGLKLKKQLGMAPVLCSKLRNAENIFKTRHTYWADLSLVLVTLIINETELINLVFYLISVSCTASINLSFFFFLGLINLSWSFSYRESLLILMCGTLARRACAQTNPDTRARSEQCKSFYCPLSIFFPLFSFYCPLHFSLFSVQFFSCLNFEV
jgi:hypothetical protein